MYYATFAMRAQVGGRGKPFPQYWILKDNELWHDVVRGDGGSYSDGGPSDLEMKTGESKKEFETRVQKYMSEWEAQAYQSKFSRL